MTDLPEQHEVTLENGERLTADSAYESASGNWLCARIADGRIRRWPRGRVREWTTTFGNNEVDE